MASQILTAGHFLQKSGCQLRYILSHALNQQTTLAIGNAYMLCCSQ
jgi:hypothetical protein